MRPHEPTATAVRPSVMPPAAVTRQRRAGAESCGRCRHFMGEPQALEKRLAGLTTLSSAYAAVRAADGLCRTHDRYVAASAHCAAWQAREKS